jgi:outer membrane protein insertion porin family
MKSEKWEVRSGRFCILISYFLLLTSYFLLPISYLPEAAGTIVGEIEINGLYSISKGELLYLLDIAPGKPLDEESVRSGIKRAFLKGLFEDISVETLDREKAKVFINIRERNIIKNIYVEGDYAIPRKTIKNLFPLKEDQIMMCDMREKAVTDLKHDLAGQGFPNASVHAEIERLKEPYRINIHLRIDTDEPLRIKKIHISGADDEVKSVMKLSDGDIYDQSILKKDLERIKAYYKRDKYFHPVVGPYTFSDGTLDISVHPGKRLHISIVDNNAITSKALLKEMPFFESEAFSDDLVEEAVHRMVSLYHKKGYPFAQVAPVISSKDDLIDLNFFIFEGPQVKTGVISLTGNSFPEKNLKEIMSLKEGDVYNPDLLDTDRETLRNFYNALGYLAADIEEFQTNPPSPPLSPLRPPLVRGGWGGEGGLPNKIDIAIKIHEGLKTEIQSVHIIGARRVPEEEVKKVINIKPGDVYNEVDIIDARYRVIDLYNTRGLIKTNVIVKSEVVDQKAAITFQIDEGTEILFGKTIITGNYSTKYRVVERELQDKENLPFDYHILTQERQKLYKLGLFTDVNIEPFDMHNNKKDVLINLHEGNAGAVELSLGYAEYERFRGILDLSYRNLWGMNRQASLRLELSSLADRYIIQYYEPWFLDIPLQFRAFLLGEYRKEINIDTRETRYRLTRHSATAGFEKTFGNALKAELYYEFSLVNTYDVQPDVVLSREDTGTLVISGIRPGIVYDTRDNLFEPRKGILSGISVKFTSPVFLSETNFMKLMFYGNLYQALSRRIVLAASFRGGIAQGYLKTNELPIVERFFLGGRTTVRGYDQDTLGPKGSDGNPTGGNVFLMENLEIRTSLGKGLGIVTFLDGGNVWVNVEDIKPLDFKFTTGLGLRYNTPVGPIRIDYGHKLQREKGESSGELHFSIGHAF